MTVSIKNLKKVNVPVYDYVLKQDYDLFLNCQCNFSDFIKEIKNYFHLPEQDAIETIKLHFEKFLKDSVFDLSFDYDWRSNGRNRITKRSLLNSLTEESRSALVSDSESGTALRIEELEMNVDMCFNLDSFFKKKFEPYCGNEEVFFILDLNKEDKNLFFDIFNKVWSETIKNVLLFDEIKANLEKQIKNKLLENNVELVLGSEKVSYYESKVSYQKRSEYLKSRKLIEKELKCLYMIEEKIDFEYMMKNKNPSITKLYLIEEGESTNKIKKLSFHDSLKRLEYPNNYEDYHNIEILTIEYNLDKRGYEKINHIMSGDYILFDNKKDAKNYLSKKLISVREKIDLLLEPKFIF